MIGNDEHSIPIDWLTKDAIRRGDMDHAKGLVGMVSLFYLEHDHPDVYNKLMDMLGVLQEKTMKPPQIGKVVMQSPQIHGAMYDISGNENVNLGGKK